MIENNQNIDNKNQTIKIEQRRKILVNHWRSLENKNQNYFTHVKGDCLCSICKCGKCKCKLQRIKIDTKIDAQTNYMKSFSPPSQKYNIGNSKIKQDIDQQETVLRLNAARATTSHTSRSVEGRTIQRKNSDCLNQHSPDNFPIKRGRIEEFSPKYRTEQNFFKNQNANNISYADQNQVNSNERQSSTQISNKLSQKNNNQKNENTMFKREQKVYTDNDIQDMCQKTNFNRQLDEIQKNNNFINRDPDQWKISTLRAESSYKKSFLQKTTAIDAPILQFQQLPPSVRSVPYNINTETKSNSNKMLHELSLINDKLKVEKQNQSQQNSLKQLQTVQSLNNIYGKNSPSQRNNKSFNSQEREHIQQEHISQGSPIKTKEDFYNVFKRKNDVTQNDFINYAQKSEKITKTVFSNYNKFLNEASSYKQTYCQKDQQLYTEPINISNQPNQIINQHKFPTNQYRSSSNDAQYLENKLNYNQIDMMINKCIQNINKVGYFQQIPCFQGQFKTSAQTHFSPEERYIECCPSVLSRKSPNNERQNCRQDEQDLIPRKYYNHRYNRVVRCIGKNKNDEKNQTITVPIETQNQGNPVVQNKPQQPQQKEKAIKK